MARFQLKALDVGVCLDEEGRGRAVSFTTTVPLYAAATGGTLEPSRTTDNRGRAPGWVDPDADDGTYTIDYASSGSPLTFSIGNPGLAARTDALESSQTTQDTRIALIREAPINVLNPPGALTAAVGDGVTDDYAAINAMIAALPAAGGEIYAAPGRNYKCNTGLAWDSRPVHIFGGGYGNQPGMGTRFTFPAGVHGFNPRNGSLGKGMGSRISKLRVIGSDAGAGSNHGILVQANSAIIEHVYVEGFAGYGVYLLSGVGVADVSINCNHSSGRDIHCSGNFTGGFGTLGVDSNAGTFEMLDLSGNGGYGLDLRSNLGNNVYGVHLNANATGGILISDGGRNEVRGVYYETENKQALNIAAGSSGSNIVHFTNAARIDAADPITDATGNNRVSLETGGQHYRRVQVGPTTAAHLVLAAGTTAALFSKGAAARFQNAAVDCNWDVQAQANKTLSFVSAQNLPIVSANGIVTKVKAGIIADADFGAAPPNGTIALDQTNSRLYVKVGGAWKSVAVA